MTKKVPGTFFGVPKALRIEKLSLEKGTWYLFGLMLRMVIFLATLIGSLSLTTTALAKADGKKAEEILRKFADTVKNKPAADLPLEWEEVTFNDDTNEIDKKKDPKIFKGKTMRPVYFLKYRLKPKRHKTDELRELELEISWVPDLAIKQNQSLRMRTYVKTDSKP